MVHLIYSTAVYGARDQVSNSVIFVNENENEMV